MEKTYITTGKHPFMLPQKTLWAINDPIPGYRIWYTVHNIVLYYDFSLNMIKMWLKHNFILATNDTVAIKDSPISDIIAAVCSITGLSISKIMENTAKRKAVQARQLIMYYSKIITSLSSARIGIAIRPSNPLNSSTVVHGKKTINNLKTNNKEIAAYVAKLDKIFNL